MHAPVIEKEKVNGLKCITQEVLNTHEAIALRKNNLLRAVILGNGYKVKSRLLFETYDGPKAVEATVWAVTDTHVLLKGGSAIPVVSIYSVE